MLQRVSEYLVGHHEEVAPKLGDEHTFGECFSELSLPGTKLDYWNLAQLSRRY